MSDEIDSVFIYNKDGGVTIDQPGVPLYPMLIFIYDQNGMHGDGIQINSEGQLHSLGVKLMLQIAMDAKVEIRITDPGDFMLFHAKGGKVLFDGERHYESS